MEYLDSTLSTVDNNVYVSTILSLFVVLYGSLAKPELPKIIEDLFKNAVFRVLFLALIMYRSNKEPQLSIMLAVGFTITMNLISEKQTRENFAL